MKKRELALICDEAIAREIKRGRLVRPHSMRNLKRWLRRELVRRESQPHKASRRRLLKAAAVILLLAGLLVAAPVNEAKAGTPTFKDQSFVAGGSNAKPALVDIDNDGDLDAFLGQEAGTILFFRNNGSASSPSLVEVTGTSNPLSGVDVGNKATPTFADIDNDGDMDAFIGSVDGWIDYYKNTGSASSPAFASMGTGGLGLTDIGSDSAPVFVDIDKDGDLDVFSGRSDGAIFYWINTGSATSPAFSWYGTGYFNLPTVGTSSTPTFVDIDNDGDMDAFVGREDGTVNYYVNVSYYSGTTTYYVVSFTGGSNPHNGVDVGSNSAPVFADIDDDGDMDAIIGGYDGVGHYFRNTGTASSPAFTPALPLDGIDLGDNTTPVFADIDGDDDMDAFFGSSTGCIDYYGNTGSVSEQAFTNIGTGLFLYSYGARTPVAFIDVDKDGDLDAFLGTSSGNISYLENSGNATSPAFETLGVGQFGLPAGVGTYSVPVFADIDDDGDLDLFVGQGDGTIAYYENVSSYSGTSYVPGFSTSATNPLTGVDVGTDSIPAFADIDSDGDLDAMVGAADGTLYYFRNDGTTSSPSFTAMTGASNPVDGLSVTGGYSAPAFADIDGDGDPDLFVGNGDGTIMFYKNIPSSGGAAGGSGGGCFVATAAYGSEMAEDVMVLRDFRDEYLLTNGPGRKFVELYYEYSPPAAEVISRHENLRAATRWALSPLVYGVKYPAAVMMVFFTGATAIIWRFRWRREE